jgi:uncharacterized protein (UPF0332 family)
VIKPTESQKPPPPVPEGPERDALVAELLDNALDYLREAESLSSDGQGRSVAHACYYASFWLSRAVLVKQNGEYPWRHDSTEALFAGIVADAGVTSPLAEALGLYIDLAKERNLCDYDRRYRPTTERADEIRDGARRFFEIVKDAFNFRDEPPGPPRGHA